MADEISYFDFIEPIWEQVNIYEGPEIFLAQFEAISVRQGHLLAAHWCQSEIRNGGFSQFFINSTGVLCPEAIVGLEKVGMPQVADIVRQAMLRLGATYPRDQAERHGVLTQLNTALAPMIEDDDNGTTGETSQICFDPPLESLDREALYAALDDEFHAPFEDLDIRFFELMNEENGGFFDAATRYALIA